MICGLFQQTTSQGLKPTALRPLPALEGLQACRASGERERERYHTYPALRLIQVLGISAAFFQIWSSQNFTSACQNLQFHR